MPARKKHRLKPVLLFTESATETIPPAARNPVIARRKTFGTSLKVREVGKGEKVG